MRTKTSNIIFFSIFFLFGIGQNIDALNYSNGLQINEDTNLLLAKENGGTNKSRNKKVQVRKEETRKVAIKKYK